jgi:hypothetical protein
MRGKTGTWAIAGLLLAAAPGTMHATTRELAEFQQSRLIFDRSVLHQLTYGMYREPFDELQTRPYNLLFTNIGRHPNLTPWQGQEGSYTRYFNALIGNNGSANVGNDADAVSGTLIRREAVAWTWGAAGAFLTGSDGSDDGNATSAFSSTDELGGFELRGAASRQLSDRRVVGFGFRVTSALSEVRDNSFEQGTGGYAGLSEYDQTDYVLDAGLREFRSPFASWEVRAVLGIGEANQCNLSRDLNGDGNQTGSYTDTNYEIADTRLALEGGYNRLKRQRIGETEFRGGIERSQRELSNSNLSYSSAGGTITPLVTLLGQDPITATRVYASAKSVFQAGETEMFAGAEIGYGMVEGATRVDASGTPVTEAIDDTLANLGLTVGLRQPVFRDRLRFIVSGRADVADEDRLTTFGTGTDGSSSSHSTAQYAIGLEGALANVTFDVAWLGGEEAPATPVTLGVPSGSRRSVELDRLVFSAAVSW